jgi:hypothetical protein
VYWAGNLNFKPGKAADYIAWARSSGAQDLMNRIEAETTIKYLGTYLTVLGLGDNDAEEWFLLPNWESLDKLRESQSWGRFQEILDEFVSQDRPGSARMMRALTDVRVLGPPASDKQ